MSNSTLATKFIAASSSNYTVGRSGRRIEQIAVHHMAGVLTSAQCGAIFQKASRGASAHYGVGNAGDIAQYVDEKNTAWTNSNWDSNCKSVTMEISNSSTGGQWPVSDAALNSAIKLMADIAKRNNLGKLVKGKSVVWHSMYVATTCPGPYLLSKLDYIIEQANIINGYGPKPQPGSDEKAVNYLVKVTTAVLNVREKPSTSSAITTQIKDYGIYTIVAETQAEGMTWGKLKSGMGWISLTYTERYSENKPAPAPVKTKQGKVNATEGLNVRSTPNGTKVGALKYGTVVTIYEEQSNWGRIGDNQWVCTDYITIISSGSASNSSNWKVGDKVKILSSATNYATGQRIADKYKNKPYTVMQKESEKTLLKEIYSWVLNKDLTRA